MKITNLPESAFSVYSEKFKQKKKSKPLALVTNGTGKVHKKKDNSKGLQEMKEIGLILSKLSSKGSVNKYEITDNISNANLLVNNSDKPKGKKINSTKIHGKKVDQNLPIENSNQIKKKKLKSKPTKNYTEDVRFVNNAETDISEAKKTFISTKITTSKAQNKPVHGKPKPIEKTKPELSSQSSNLAKKGLKTKQNSEIEIEGSPQIKIFKTKKGNQKHSGTVEETNFQQIKPNESNNKESNKCLQKPAVSEIGNQLKPIHWTNQKNSIKTSKKLFEWLILPIKEWDFKNKYWEKKPLLIKREGSRKHYCELLSTPAIDTLFKENCVFFTKHVDVTSYTDGVRETHNLSGRAQANVVWDFYSNGCSIRLLNPQAFIPRIHALNASLQEYFGSFVGANVYLTPPNSQGFAPHYDDIEAFVLQIEGKKRWKVYEPRNNMEALPRLSSPNFSEKDIGKPVLEVTLEPGDMLYFPRGFIHQASTVEGEHSLHITLSAYQKTAWVDLLEKALPIALKRAAAEDVEFRRGLPLNYLGLEHHGNDLLKAQFLGTAMVLMDRLRQYMSVSLGAGVDQMGAQFMHDALPPVFTLEEKLSSGLGGGLTMQENGLVKNRVDIGANTQVKLIRANICRLVDEENEVRLYHCLDNPLEYHAEEPQFLVLPVEGVAVITVLSQKYPEYVKVRSLPHDDFEALMVLVSDLWDAGLLLAKEMVNVDED